MTLGHGARLFLISFLALYAELICIRWIPAYVRFVAYFTNFILLASFLGLGAGILAARRKVPIGLATFSWLLLGVVALVAATRFELRIESAGVLYYGASEEGGAPSENALVLPAAFMLVSLLFACVGRELGTLLAIVKPPLRAYGLDIGGSIAGIAAFFCLSFTQQPPVVWFGGLLLIMLILVLSPSPFTVPAPTDPATPRPAPTWWDRTFGARPWLRALVVLPPLVASVAVSFTLGRDFWWSPYYKVGITPIEEHPGAAVVTVNNVGHQIMIDADAKEPFYYVPYDLLGTSPIERALIIGAGSGSDVAVALRRGVKQVDAVEIDPVITQVGRAHHPNRPFDDPRVTLHVDDGRSFLRKTPHRYDLIVFALPDSLTLTSQFASLRLESFLFTREAMAEARDRLTPNGAVVLYNFYRETWLLRKIAGMLEVAHGTPPYVVSYGGWGRAAVLVNGPRLQNTLPFRPDVNRPYQESQVEIKRFQDDPDALYLPVIGMGILASDATSGFAEQPEITATGRTLAMDLEMTPSLATDDWPLMYLPQPTLPGVYLAALAMVAVCALTLVFALGGRASVSGFNGHMFFLGAAFMLLETKSLVTFGLLFGNTWMVNSLVFFAILCSVLTAVFVSARFPVRPSPISYTLLLGALLLAYLVPDSALLGVTPTALRYAIASLIAFLPIFLANLVFAGAFKTTGQAADVAFASNLLGIMVGGMLEYAALVWGYRHLLLLAILFYTLSAVLLTRWRPRRGRALDLQSAPA